MKLKTVTSTQARTELFELINAAKHGHQTTIILKNGKPAAKIAPIDQPRQNNDVNLILKQAANTFTSSDQNSTSSFRQSVNSSLNSK